MKIKSSLRQAGLFGALGAALLFTRPAPAAQNAQVWVTLDSDIPGISPNHDANLINPWGCVLAADGASFWVADNGAGVLTRYLLNGEPYLTPPANTAAQVITVPSASGSSPGSPTAVIIDHTAFATPAPTGEFMLGTAPNLVPSQLLVATEDGQIGGFNPAADATHVIIKVAAVTGSSYTGLALASVDIGAGTLQHRLFAVNYGASTIDVFREDFTQILPLPAVNGVAAFADPQAVTGFAPYNIQRYSIHDAATKSIQRVLVVTYVNKADPTGGGGYVNVFNPDGSLVTQLVNYGVGNGLDAPWGLVIARNGSASTADDMLLVGNFGDGTIHRFSLAKVFSKPAAVFDSGPLLRVDGSTLIFDDLWSVQPGRPPLSLKAFAADDDELGPQDGTLYFTAGIPAGADEEQHGLTGRIYKNSR